MDELFKRPDEIRTPIMVKVLGWLYILYGTYELAIMVLSFFTSHIQIQLFVFLYFICGVGLLRLNNVLRIVTLVFVYLRVPVILYLLLLPFIQPVEMYPAAVFAVLLALLLESGIELLILHGKKARIAFKGVCS